MSLKWEQLFVAVSDCGKYKLEVDLWDPDSPEEGWDWTIYSYSDDYEFLTEAEHPCQLAWDAKREAEHVLEKIVANKRKAVEKLLIEGDASGFKKPFNPMLQSMQERLPRCKFCDGTGVHDCPGGEFRGEFGTLTVFPGKVDAAAFPAAAYDSGTIRFWKAAVNTLYDAPGHSCCGATSVEHMSDCPAVHTSQGDFWAPPKDVRSDEFSCPVLEENVQEKIDPKQGRLIPSTGSVALATARANGASLATKLELASALADARTEDNPLGGNHEAVITLLTGETPKKSGYEQILSSIRAEAKDIKL